MLAMVLRIDLLFLLKAFWGYFPAGRPFGLDSQARVHTPELAPGVFIIRSELPPDYSEL
jgi:hypothetical protein